MAFVILRSQDIEMLFSLNKQTKKITNIKIVLHHLQEILP